MLESDLWDSDLLLGLDLWIWHVSMEVSKILILYSTFNSEIKKERFFSTPRKITFGVDLNMGCCPHGHVDQS